MQTRADKLLLAAMVFGLPLAALAQPAPSAPPAVPAYLTRAMNDPARSADKPDDARRQMTAMLSFSGVKPGDRVLELLPGPVTGRAPSARSWAPRGTCIPSGLPAPNRIQKIW
ncbi:MAG: hypothetical protein ACRETQ_03070 [Gammaproteobacteria bacterium]